MAMISSALRALLDERITSSIDLPLTPSLVSLLREDLLDFEARFLHLLQRLSSSISGWESHSRNVKQALHHLSSSHTSNYLGVGEGIGSSLGVELPQLAEEARRIETARRYVETTLRLETLVGDLEDAALSYMGQNPGSIIARESSDAFNPTKQGKLKTSIKTMNVIEDVLIDIVKHQLQWNRLIAAVDSRVDKVFGIIKPQALKEYRDILSSCGWPPSLASLLDKERRKELFDPLLSMKSNEGGFSKCFLGLCALQHLRDRRKTRNLENFVTNDGAACLDENLWAIDELVSSLAPWLEHHFSKWSDQPKFIFALVYKITQDFLEAIDDVLQPLMDEARLVLYSAKEAWVSAMVKMLSVYLKNAFFPVLSESYEVDDLNSEVRSSWLNLVDLIIESDKRMRALANSGILLKDNKSELGGGSTLNLLVCIFQDHPDWLQTWAEIELRDVEEKLKSELEDDNAWKIRTVFEGEDLDKKSEFLLFTREDYRAPIIADSLTRTSLAMIERGKALPGIPIRVQFIKSSACILMNWFYKVLLQRCEEAKSTTSVIEEESMHRLVGAVNAARYCESVMQGWTDDVLFLEIADDMRVAKSKMRNETNDENSLFQEEIENMIKLETDCLLDIVSLLLLEFDSRSRKYIQRKGNDGPEDDKVNICLDEELLSVSSEFVEALDILSEWLKLLKCSLNPKDFVDLWRSVAGGLDHFIFNSMVLGKVKYGYPGIEQFVVDMKMVFLVFRPFCIRPEAFFPCVSDSLKLMAIPHEEAGFLMGDSFRGDELQEDFLKSHGIFHLTVKQARRLFSKPRTRKSIVT